METKETTAKDVINLYSQLNSLGIKIWIDGGWGVDALLGKQTRPHGDVDIVIEQKGVPKLRKLLGSWDYKDIERDDTSSWNFVLGDDSGHEVDVHAVTFDEKGNGLYGPMERGIMYPAASLTGMGKIDGQTVTCISPEYLVKFHTGYKFDETDFKDVSALCERFGIAMPHEYSGFEVKWV